MKNISKLLTLALLVSLISAPMWAMEEEQPANNNQNYWQDGWRFAHPIDTPKLTALVLDAIKQATEGNIEPLQTLLQEKSTLEFRDLSANSIYNLVLLESDILAQIPGGIETFIESVILRVLANDLDMNLNCQYKDGHHQGLNPLCAAVFKGSLPLVTCLIHMGADVNRTSSGDVSPLMQAADSGQHVIADFLIQNGADINYKVGCKYPQLFLALFHRKTETVRFLLEHGANPNIHGDNIYNPPMIAGDTSHMAALKMFCIRPCFLRVGSVLAKKMNSDDPNQKGILSQDDLDCTQLLLDHGAAIDERDADGGTLLMYLAGCHIPAFQPMITHLETVGIQITREELCDGLDLTPLAKLLLDYGADRDLKNNEGQTARDIAEKYGNTAMVKLLDTHKPWVFGLNLKAAHAMFTRWGTMAVADVQGEMSSLPAELQEAMTFIAPKAIKDKINGNLSNENVLAIENIKNDNNK